jgi:ABC-type bacteriocin/lantibiotic exporter with double-glycine peptidase domain
MTNRSIWRYYFGFFHGSSLLVAISIFISICQAFLLLPIAVLVRFIFDTVIPSGNIAWIGLTGLVIISIYLLLSLSQLWTKNLMGKLSTRSTQQLRMQLMENLISLPRDYYSQADWGKLQSSIVMDTERVSRMSEYIVVNLIPAICMSVVISLFLIHQTRYLFLILAICLPFLYILSRMSSHRVHRWAKNHQTDLRNFNRGVLAAIQQLELTYLQTAGEQQRTNRQREIETLGETSRKLTWYKAVHSILQENIILISSVLVLIAGGAAVAAQSISLGKLMAFYAGIMLLKPNLQMISGALLPIIEGHASLTALYQLYISFPQQPYRGTYPIRFMGEIEYRNVTFFYKETPILKDVNLHLPAGSLTAIVGPNGSGKSTLIYLVIGFYRPQTGSVFADGQPYDNLDMLLLRRQIGVVPQDVSYFSGSILENITFGSPKAAIDQVVDAATLADAHEFIQSMPDKYDTKVGEKGILLSGGQRQRIALARAILRQPQLLILDEPTNHLDEKSALDLIRRLRRLPNHPTILLITHDRHLANEAENVYSINNGCLMVSNK